MTVVIDASALLADVQGEAGAEVVEEALMNGARCSAATWSEGAQKVLAADKDCELVHELLMSFDLRVEPVTFADAEWAARRWRRGEGLSFSDRPYLALAARTGTAALTADGAWGHSTQVRQIRPR
ncbi:MAG: PIN domain-containing protein [Actinobacteria bacterium]|nr:PIN domain-containing protein [Actinomycetota bacterium]